MISIGQNISQNDENYIINRTNYRLDDTYSVMISYQTPINQDKDDDLGVYWVPIAKK